jgi:hypothetical protein
MVAPILRRERSGRNVYVESGPLFVSSTPQAIPKMEAWMRQRRQGDKEEKDIPGSDSKSPLSIIFILGYEGLRNIHPQCEYHNPFVAAYGS